jgi:hypothetical protein
MFYSLFFVKGFRYWTFIFFKFVPFSSYSVRFVVRNIGPLQGLYHINTTEHKHITKTSIYRALNMFQPTIRVRTAEGTA